jgi:hypothetical protein
MIKPFSAKAVVQMLNSATTTIMQINGRFIESPFSQLLDVVKLLAFDYGSCRINGAFNEFDHTDGSLL